MHAVTWMGLRNIMLTGSCLPGRPTQLSHPSQTYLCGWVRTHACTHAWCGPPTWQARHFLPQILCARSSSAWTVLLPDSSPLLSLPSGLCSHVAYERGFPLTIPYKT